MVEGTLEIVSPWFKTWNRHNFLHEWCLQGKPLKKSAIFNKIFCTFNFPKIISLNKLLRWSKEPKKSLSQNLSSQIDLLHDAAAFWALSVEIGKGKTSFCSLSCSFNLNYWSETWLKLLKKRSLKLEALENRSEFRKMPKKRILRLKNAMRDEASVRFRTNLLIDFFESF